MISFRSSPFITLIMHHLEYLIYPNILAKQYFLNVCTNQPVRDGYQL